MVLEPSSFLPTVSCFEGKLFDKKQTCGVLGTCFFDSLALDLSSEPNKGRWGGGGVG